MKPKKEIKPLVKSEPKFCPFTFGNPNGAGKCLGRECQLWFGGCALVKESV